MTEPNKYLNRDNIAIVLVQPITAGNIGSIARAMTNMGFSDLRLVQPVADHTSEDAQKLAHGSTELLFQAKTYETIQEAVSDCVLSIATSHKPIRDNQESYLARDIGPKLIPYCEQNKVAILFGTEPKGLSNEEIAFCTWCTHIPAARDYPSLNLAQAVMLICYELFLTSVPSQNSPYPKFASSLEIEKFLEYLENLLELVGFQHKNERPELFLGILRRTFTKIGLENRELRTFYKLFEQVRYCIEQRCNVH